MLNKEYCKICWNKTMGWEWDKIAPLVENWKDGRIICPVQFVEKGEKYKRKITDKTTKQVSILFGEYIIMALKKELCIKCWDSNKIGRYGWCEWDETNWKNGVIECPEKYIEEYDKRDIKEPPSKCPFMLEHILIKED